LTFGYLKKGSWTCQLARSLSSFPRRPQRWDHPKWQRRARTRKRRERRVEVNNFFKCPVFFALPEECTLPSPSYSCEQLGGPSCNHAGYLSRLAKNVVQFASQRATRRALHCAQEKHSSKNRNIRKETLSLLGFRARKSKLPVSIYVLLCQPGQVLRFRFTLARLPQERGYQSQLPLRANRCRRTK